MLTNTCKVLNQKNTGHIYVPGLFLSSTAAGGWAVVFHEAEEIAFVINGKESTVYELTS